MTGNTETVVKICGVRTAAAAIEAANAGADIIGMIFAPSPRLISIETGHEIAKAVRAADSNQQPLSLAHSSIKADASASEYFSACAQHLLDARKKFGRPLLAGVFQNQDLEHILDVVKQVPLDLVQLHGTESIEMCLDIPVPVIKVFHVDDTFSQENESELFKTFRHSLILLDTKVAGTSQQGGRGVSFDWGIARKLGDTAKVPFLMAGGLTPENISEAVAVGRPWGVDVSSGVETEKAKDSSKIHAFARNARK
ncbi:anthranilate synthase / indole-3-glycerol phosphate synthase [Coemansia sp. Benny D115]|nr:anthranilate synthase / indole-3-glycerol phosphate synthase [Coemansia sp. Benny D115]